MVAIFKTLWTNQTLNEHIKEQFNFTNIDPITFEEFNIALEAFKNRKPPGSDEINIEFIKYTADRAKLRM